MHCELNDGLVDMSLIASHTASMLVLGHPLLVELSRGIFALTKARDTFGGNLDEPGATTKCNGNERVLPVSYELLTLENELVDLGVDDLVGVGVLLETTSTGHLIAHSLLLGREVESPLGPNMLLGILSELVPKGIVDHREVLVHHVQVGLGEGAENWLGPCKHLPVVGLGGIGHDERNEASANRALAVEVMFMFDVKVVDALQNGLFPLLCLLDLLLLLFDLTDLP